MFCSSVVVQTINMNYFNAFSLAFASYNKCNPNVRLQAVLWQIFHTHSMIIRHDSSSNWVRSFCFASSWLTERSKCAFQDWTAREHSLSWEFILALVSSLMTKRSSLIYPGISNQESHIYDSECHWRVDILHRSHDSMGRLGMYGSMVAAVFVSTQMRF